MICEVRLDVGAKVKGLNFVMIFHIDVNINCVMVVTMYRYSRLM